MPESSLPPEVTEAVGLLGEGIALRQRGQPAAALACFDRALDGFRPYTTTGQVVAQTHAARGDVLLALGRPAEALSACARATGAVLADPPPDRETLAAALTTAAVAFRTLGEVDRAAELLREALTLVESTGRHTPLTASILSSLGVIHARRGDGERALAFYERGAEVAAEVDPGGLQEASALGNLGGMLRDLGSAVQGVSLLQRAVALTATHAPGSPQLATQLWSLAMSFLLVGDLPEARRQIERAHAVTQQVVPDSELHSRVLSVEARIVTLEHDHPRAVELLSEAVGLLAGHGDTLDLLDRRIDLATALFRADRADDALAEATRAEQSTEAIRLRLGNGPARRRVFATASRAHDLLIALLLARSGAGDDVAALEVVERRKARGLADDLAIARARSGSASPELIALEAERRTTQQALQQAHFALIQDGTAPGDAPFPAGEIRQIAVGLRERAEQIDQRIAATAAAEPAIDAPAMSALLADGGAMIQVAVIDGQVVVWTLTADDVTSTGVPLTLEQLTTLMRLVLDPVREGGEPDPHALDALTRLLADGLPAAADDVVVIADGPLHWFPFELLADSRRDRPIGLSRRISYAPSATVLAGIRSHWRAPSEGWEVDLFALGDPAYVPEQFSGDGSSSQTRRLDGVSLPGSRDEVNRIAGLYERHELRTGEAATEVAVKTGAPRARRVQLACHGVVDDAEPLYGGLVLAPPTPAEAAADSTADDLLAVWEIATLGLCAELVVCSACSTGLGPVVRGEGIVGMTGAVLTAGARSTIVSLWPVDDAITATFMAALHVNLTNGATVAEALRLTRDNISKSTSSPRHWAAWVLHGLPGD